MCYFAYFTSVSPARNPLRKSYKHCLPTSLPTRLHRLFVEDQLNNRSRGAMPKSCKGIIAMRQVAHKCVERRLLVSSLYIGAFATKRVLFSRFTRQHRFTFLQGSSSPRTFFSSLSFVCFEMEGLIVVFSSLSFDYFAWRSLIVCFTSHFKLRTLSRLQRRCKITEKATPSKLS